MRVRDRAIWALKGAATGAVACVALSVLGVLLVGGIVAARPDAGRLVGNWGLEETYAFFCLAGASGVILGMYLGLKRSRLVEKWFAAATGFGVPLICGLWFLYAYASRVEIPREEQLAILTNGWQRIHVMTPRGHCFHIVVKCQTGSEGLKWRAHVVDGPSRALDFSSTEDSLKQQYEFFSPLRNYDVELAFERPPYAPAAVWLKWRQAYKDRSK